MSLSTPSAPRHRQKVGHARRRRIYERDQWRCQLCGADFTDAIPQNPRWAPWIAGLGYLHVDHIIPVSRGGSVRDESNLRALCQPCNLRKGAK